MTKPATTPRPTATAAAKATAALATAPANLTQLAQALSKRHRMPAQAMQKLLAEAFELIEIGTLAHGRFVVRGFGMWRMRVAAPRVGRNPHAGTAVPLAARAQMTFLHGKDRRGSFSELGLRLVQAAAAEDASEPEDAR